MAKRKAELTSGFSGRPDAPGSEDSVRLDIWLWRARFCKTRSSAQTLISSGKVRIGRGPAVYRVDKPHFALAPGDRVSFVAPTGRLVQVEVVALGVRRGPAPEARALYVDLASGPDASTGEEA